MEKDKIISTTKTVLLLLLAEVYDRWPAGGDIPREEITAWLDSRLTHWHWRFAPDPDEVQQARARIGPARAGKGGGVRVRDKILGVLVDVVNKECKKRKCYWPCAARRTRNTGKELEWFCGTREINGCPPDDGAGKGEG